MTAVVAILASVLTGATAFFLVYPLARWVGQAMGEVRPVAETSQSAAVPGRHPLVTLYAKKLAPWLPKQLVGELRRRITMAGGLDQLTPAELTLYAAGTALAGLAMGTLLVLVTGWSAPLVLLTALGGAILPFVWLHDQVKKRHLEILNALPYHIDLLTLCVEAGLDFNAGMHRMVEQGKEGALIVELRKVLTELRVGKSRAEALTAMAERVGLNQLTSFVGALVQADRLGTSMAATLRLQAEQLRNERFQRAETAAQEAPVKMLIPLVIFIFPTIWIILSAPLVYRWMFLAPPM